MSLVVCALLIQLCVCVTPARVYSCSLFDSSPGHMPYDSPGMPPPPSGHPSSHPPPSQHFPPQSQVSIIVLIRAHSRTGRPTVSSSLPQGGYSAQGAVGYGVSQQPSVGYTASQPPPSQGPPPATNLMAGERDPLPLVSSPDPTLSRGETVW